MLRADPWGSPASAASAIARVIGVSLLVSRLGSPYYRPMHERPHGVSLYDLTTPFYPGHLKSLTTLGLQTKANAVAAGSVNVPPEPSSRTPFSRLSARAPTIGSRAESHC